MTTPRRIASIAAGLTLAMATSLLGGTPAAAADIPPDQCSAEFHDNDPRLGPEQLPTVGRVGRELIGYHRTGRLSDTDFLATYYDSSANGGSGGWRYPPADGYLTDGTGQPIKQHETLEPGEDIDRYGSEYGAFLAPEGLPYSTRSIPPQSLDGTPAATCNYHDYRVLKPFTVDAGPIAPWFEEPGLGWQYQLNSGLVPGAPTRLNVLWLVDNGYLERIV